MVAQPKPIVAFMGQTYKNQTIQIDGVQFIDCRFEFCTLEFAGEALPLFQRCTLVDVSWSVVGAAANTIGFLEMLHNQFGTGGRHFIEDVFDLIRSGPSLPQGPGKAGEITSTGRGPNHPGLATQATHKLSTLDEHRR